MPVLFGLLQSIQHLLHQGMSAYIIMAAQSEHEHLGIGATSFLFTEYQYVGVFMVAFAIKIYLFLGFVEGFSTKSQPCIYTKDKTCKPALANAIFSTVSFLLGAITSMVSDFLGMKIATYANARAPLEARKGVVKAIITAFRSGAVMGFLLATNGLLVLYIAINLFKLYYGQYWEGLFEAITSYGLGGSSMTLFGRVGGGIYTKVADVSADLVGMVERNIPVDDPRSLAVIADNDGDNVRDINWFILLSTFTIFNFGVQKTMKNWELFFCVAMGLWAGLVIGFVTEYYISNAYNLCKMLLIHVELESPLTLSSDLPWDTNLSSFQFCRLSSVTKLEVFLGWLE